MASVYLSAQSNAPGASTVVLINGEPSTTGYRLLNVDVGNPAFEKQYSGPRGSLGAVLAGETAQNRLSTFRLQAVGTSQDDLETKLSVLWVLDEQLRRYGGTVVWRPQGSTTRMRITALDSGVSLEALDVNLFVLNNRANVNLGIVSGPYYEGEPMDILDDFAVDTLANYTFDTGSAANLAVAGGVLTVTGSPSTEKRLIHTDRGYSYGDHQVTLAATPGSTISSFKAGVVLKRIDASNYLEVYVDDNATNSRLRIDKVVATVRTNLASTNLAARVVERHGVLGARAHRGEHGLRGILHDCRRRALADGNADLLDQLHAHRRGYHAVRDSLPAVRPGSVGCPSRPRPRSTTSRCCPSSTATSRPR